MSVSWVRKLKPFAQGHLAVGETGTQAVPVRLQNLFFGSTLEVVLRARAEFSKSFQIFLKQCLFVFRAVSIMREKGDLAMGIRSLENVHSPHFCHLLLRTPS